MKKGYVFLALAVALSAALVIGGSVLATTTETSASGSTVSSITLTGSNGGAISWKASSVSSQGFKVVWSKNENPTYPCREGDQYHYYSESSKTSDTVDAFKGAGTYHVRVCEYLGGKCGTYSNQIKIALGDLVGNDKDEHGCIGSAGYSWCEAKNKCLRSWEEACAAPAEKVTAITLKGEGSNISWEANGYSANGFKVVWSMNENPTYPTRDGDKYHYLSDSKASSDFITPFNGNGSYYVRVCEYLGGKCGVYSNQISVNLANAEVKAVKQIEEIRDNASDLYNNKIDALLAKIDELKSIVKEQQVQINHLMKLKEGLGQSISAAIENAIKNFIAYGVDANSKNLGEGERAAVMYSFKAAFGKLPETESELEDAIKIANGRWPSLVSDEAENQAKAQFKKIYLREADMNNAHDAAAIKVMAYGLRQQAKNRNLHSEAAALKTFKAIFKKLPQTTEEWNALQAITYSGATR